MLNKKEKVNIIILGSTNSGRSTTVERNGEQDDKHIYFEMNNHSYDIVDIIGHKNFIKNIISGYSKAHVVLIIAALQQDINEFDLQFQQIKQQLIITQTLGVKQLIVALNKIDRVDFSENEFTLMKNQIENYLDEIKFYPQSICFLPVSGVKGDNLVELSQNTPWYQGKTLFQAFSQMNNFYDLKLKALRMPIKEVYKIGGVGTVPIGRVETGFLKPGMMIKFSPCGLLAECSQFEMMHHPMDEATPGDNMGFSIKGIEASEIKKGNVASDAERDPVMKAISFIAQVILIGSSKQLEVGQVSQLSIHYTKVDCRIKSILYKTDNRTGALLEENPKSISKRGSAFVEIEPLQLLCIEEYSQYPPLGRFILQDADQIIAVGIVQKVEKQINS